MLGPAYIFNMKNLTILLAVASVIFLQSCAKNPANSNTEVAETVHSFYKWYNAFQGDTTRNCLGKVAVPFGSPGQFTKLDSAALERYVAAWKTCPSVNEEFLKNQRAFWKNCSVTWGETIWGDEINCMEVDNFMCAQDGDAHLYETTDVNVKVIDETHVEATFAKKESDVIGNAVLYLAKQDGKWSVSNIACP